jgi:hypothetical protein
VLNAKAFIASKRVLLDKVINQEFLNLGDSTWGGRAELSGDTIYCYKADNGFLGFYMFDPKGWAEENGKWSTEPNDDLSNLKKLCSRLPGLGQESPTETERLVPVRRNPVLKPNGCTEGVEYTYKLQSNGFPNDQKYDFTVCQSKIIIGHVSGGRGFVVELFAKSTSLDLNTVYHDLRRDLEKLTEASFAFFSKTPASESALSPVVVESGSRDEVEHHAEELPSYMNSGTGTPAYNELVVVRKYNCVATPGGPITSYTTRNVARLRSDTDQESLKNSLNGYALKDATEYCNRVYALVSSVPSLAKYILGIEV